jgi:hypothetical protein
VGLLLLFAHWTRETEPRQTEKAPASQWTKEAPVSKTTESARWMADGLQLQTLPAPFAARVKVKAIAVVVPSTLQSLIARWVDPLTESTWSVPAAEEQLKKPELFSLMAILANE